MTNQPLQRVPDGTVPHVEVHPPPRISRRHRTAYDRISKPVLDWLGAVLLLIVLLPVLAGVSLAVRAKLGSPVLIRQSRVGRDGRVFTMYKFRTMLPSRRLVKTQVTPEADRRHNHKSATDPRHTPLGRFLRRSSLDELPQLFNVLRGDMSLVGPRPELVEVVEAVYQPWQLERHLVKPGLTGLWQVTERQEGDGVMHLHTALDLAYIESRGLRTDLGILMRTPAALVVRHASPKRGVWGARRQHQN
jgi:lipopolysaccharide/colanic/teichoic acid biosynthesis glycosyltransferase